VAVEVCVGIKHGPGRPEAPVTIRWRVSSRLTTGEPQDMRWPGFRGKLAEKLAAAFTSTSNVALAYANVIRPKKTAARNIRPSYQNQSVDAKYRSDLQKIARFVRERAFFALEPAGLAQL
jgi:hypothetical protein